MPPWSTGTPDLGTVLAANVSCSNAVLSHLSSRAVVNIAAAAAGFVGCQEFYVTINYKHSVIFRQQAFLTAANACIAVYFHIAIRCEPCPGRA